jgi:hypothetical protein
MVMTLSILAAALVLVALFRPFFGDAAGFFACLRFWFTPDLFIALRGEFWDDWWPR